MFHVPAAWAIIDNGHLANVSSVAVLAGGSIPPGTVLSISVFESLTSLTQQQGGAACSPAPLPLAAGAWATQACSQTGR